MMGWTGSQYYGKGSRKDFLIQEFKQANATHTWWLSDISMRGSTAYCISWVKDETTGEEKHEGMVILTEKRRGDEGWIYYKAIGESVLPYYFNAPKSLIAKLNKLGEPYNDNARQWREQCLTNASKAKVKIEIGTILKFPKKMKFNNSRGGFEDDTFIYANYYGKRNVFRTQDGNICRIPNWQKQDYTIVGVSNVQ
jgi:hypothetical protein